MSRSGSTTRTQSKESVVRLGAAKAATHDAIDTLLRAQAYAASVEAKDCLRMARAHAERALRTISRRIARVEAGR